MDVFDELQTEEVRGLRNRYYELYGRSCGYHWEEFGSIEDYKSHLRKKILEREQEKQRDK